MEDGLKKRWMSRGNHERKKEQKDGGWAEGNMRIEKELEQQYQVELIV